MSDRRVAAAAWVLTLIGLGIAGYLTYVHYRGIQPVCFAHGGCERVQASSYAKLAGVPVALLGLVGYAGIAVTQAFRGDAARLAAVLITVVGVGFSGYLTYRELFTIHAICQWCVASAIVMTLLCVLSVLRYLRAGAPPARD